MNVSRLLVIAGDAGGSAAAQVSAKGEIVQAMHAMRVDGRQSNGVIGCQADTKIQRSTGPPRARPNICRIITPFHKGKAGRRIDIDDIKLANEQQRKDVIAYFKQFSPSQ